MIKKPNGKLSGQGRRIEKNGWNSGMLSDRKFQGSEINLCRFRTLGNKYQYNQDFDKTEFAAGKLSIDFGKVVVKPPNEKTLELTFKIAEPKKKK